MHDTAPVLASVPGRLEEGRTRARHRQYARIAGASVVAVDVVAEKLQLAKDLGAEYTVNASTEDPVAAIQTLGGADAAIALAAAQKPFEQAYGSLRRGGRLVFVGLPADNRMTLPIFETVLQGITVTGRSSAPASTWPRRSSSTLRGAPGSSERRADSSRSTTPSPSARRTGAGPTRVRPARAGPARRTLLTGKEGLDAS